jgi:hypothetical protein
MTPLLVANTDAKPSSVQLNTTLLTTIFVITVGSSLQFGYGTGMQVHQRIFILLVDSNDDVQEVYFSDHLTTYSRRCYEQL